MQAVGAPVSSRYLSAQSAQDIMPACILCAGLAQFSILTASALVPLRLDWKTVFQQLPPLHRQMYWIYGGYVVLSIVAFALLSVLQAGELAAGNSLARGLCAYIAVFWGIRLRLQAVLDVEEYLTAWWLRLGEHTLTVLFGCFSLVYTFAAFRPGS
jgi:hypothetical protein